MTRINSHPDDPRALIGEAYRIEGLTEQDARSIFFDWAIGLPTPSDAAAAARRLLEHHAAEPEGHPMTGLLRAAADTQATAASRRSRRS